MNTKAGRIVALLCMAAVLVYTVYSYYTGCSSIGFVVAAILCIGLPMMNMIRLMVEGKDE